MPVDSQFDFSGGENSVSDKLLVAPNEATTLQNLFIRRGGGLTSRKGYKDLGASLSTGPGRAVFEIDQSVPTVLTFDNSGAGFQYFEEQMQPRFRWFEQTPLTGSWVVIGSREKFTQLILNMLYAYTVAGNTFQWQVSDGAGGFIDKTAQIVETIANSKQMRGVAGEWQFSWPDFADWLPQQVETRVYQYYLRIACTLGGTNGGSDVVHGQKFVRGNMLGRRILVTCSDSMMEEWPGLTLTRVSIESFSAGLKVQRVRGTTFNDYFYYGSDGQRQLRIFNGARGPTRAGGSNVPVNAGLTAPSTMAAPTQQANAAAYPNGYVIRARTSYVYGVEGRRGEGPPSASTEVTLAGVNQITWNLAAPIATAATKDVHAIILYVTDDLSATQGTLRDDITGFFRIATIVRDDANWNAGTFVDAYAPRSKSSPTPVSYDGSPPFYPKYVVRGGERLWIADDYRVAWSDIGRADMFDPANIKSFPSVIGILWRNDRLLVFESENIQQIRGVNEGLPIIDYFYRGLGNVQADALTIGDGNVFFMSRQGPARIWPDDTVRRIATKRTWESAFYWNGKAGERSLAQGAYFNRRWWIPVDSGGGAQYVDRVATFDMDAQADGAWSFQLHRESQSLTRFWAALGVVHAPLDHALARELILLGFPDSNGTTLQRRLCLLEYGTTDNWTTVGTDGQKLTNIFESRGIPLGFLQEWKQFERGYLRYKMPGAGGVTMNVYLLADIGGVQSKILSVATASALVRELKVEWTEIAGLGVYREVAPQLHLDALTDSGLDIYAWWLEGENEGWNLL